MNRHVVAGLLGLALAGCAQGLSVVKQPNPHMPAVELTPGMASIHESINRENPKIDPRSLRADLRAIAAAQDPGDGALAIVPTVAHPALAAGRAPRRETPRPGAKASESASPRVADATVASAEEAEKTTDPAPASADAVQPSPQSSLPEAMAGSPTEPATSAPTASPASPQSEAGEAARAFAEAQRSATSVAPGEAIAQPATIALTNGGPSDLSARPPSSQAQGVTGRTTDPLMDYNPYAAPSPQSDSAASPSIPNTLPNEPAPEAMPEAPSKNAPTAAPTGMISSAPVEPAPPVHSQESMPVPAPLEQETSANPAPTTPAEATPSQGPAAVPAATPAAPLKAAPAVIAAPDESVGNATPAPDQAPAGPSKAMPAFDPSAVPVEPRPSAAETTPAAPSKATPSADPSAEAPAAPSKATPSGDPSAEVPAAPSKATPSADSSAEAPATPSKATPSADSSAEAPAAPSKATPSGDPTVHAPAAPSKAMPSGDPTVHAPAAPSKATPGGDPSAEAVAAPSKAMPSGDPTVHAPAAPSKATPSGDPAAEAPAAPAKGIPGGDPSSQVATPVPSDPSSSAPGLDPTTPAAPAKIPPATIESPQFANPVAPDEAKASPEVPGKVLPTTPSEPNAVVPAPAKTLPAGSSSPRSGTANTSASNGEEQTTFVPNRDFSEPAAEKVAGNRDPLLGPHPEIWPDIKLPPVGTPPRIATAPTEAATDGSGMPEPAIAPAATSETPTGKSDIAPPPAEAAPAPTAEPAPPRIALPDEPLTLPEPPPIGNGSAPAPDPFPEPAEAGPTARRPVRVDPSVSRTSTAIVEKPKSAKTPVQVPASEDPPRPLPFDPAELPIELPSISGPDEALLNLDGLRPGISDGPPVELPLADPGRASLSRLIKPSGARDSMIRTVSFNQGEPRTSSDATAVRIPVDIEATRATFEAGRPAARVGDEVITLLELRNAISLRRKGLPAGPLDAPTRYALAKSVLADLVDRSIVVQEARRSLKNPKQIELFMTQADKVWEEDELPPLLRETASSNIHELKRKMEERGESLNDQREAFRKEFLFRGFIEHKVGPRLKVELPEMRRYYLDHLREFDRPAQITWKEIHIEDRASGGRDAARRKAEELVTRLLRGEDFASLARAESHGPNKSSGGSWQTSPGGYGVAEVNAALDILPIGRVSRVIEGPTGCHLVLVEARRPAGPAPFGAVQDQIHKTLRTDKIRKESMAYLERLRAESVVTTVFDNATPSLSSTAAMPR